MVKVYAKVYSDLVIHIYSESTNLSRRIHSKQEALKWLTKKQH